MVWRFTAHACCLAMPLATEANEAWLAAPDRSILQYPTCKQFQGDFGCMQIRFVRTKAWMFQDLVRARKAYAADAWRYFVHPERAASETLQTVLHMTARHFVQTT